MIPYPVIDPVLLEVGPFAIRWYSLSYIAGIILGWCYLVRINKLPIPAFPQKALDDIMIWVIFGIVLGGRVGYVLFYNLPYFADHPGDVLKLWQGGMSFHGGMIGTILAIYLLCRRHKIDFLPAMDRVAVVAPIGLMLGRLANFINGELYGRVSDVPWAMIFPGDPFARHPSQLYQAALEGLALLIILSIAVRFYSIRNRAGQLSGIFLMFYAMFRSFAELFREPDTQLGFIAGHVTMGQILCIPMFLLGLFFLLRPTTLEKEAAPVIKKARKR